MDGQGQQYRAASLRRRLLQRGSRTGRCLGSYLGSVHALLGACWILSSTTFYHFYNGWSWTVAFYYAVQAGLSVGFGSISEETDHLGERPLHEHLVLTSSN